MLSLILNILLLTSLMQLGAVIFKPKKEINSVHTNGFADLFKRKEGGTTIGNAIRGLMQQKLGFGENFLKIPEGGSDGGRSVTRELQNITARVKDRIANSRNTNSGASSSQERGLNIFNTQEENDAKKDNKDFIKKMFPKDKKWYMMPGVWIICGLGFFVYWKWFRKGGKKGFKI